MHAGEDKDRLEFVDKVKQAVAKRKMIDRKLAHSIFVGPPGSGKSSLMDKLLHRARKFSSSTGVSDPVVIVDIDNPSTFHSVTVMDTDTWKEVDYDISLLKQMSTVTTSSQVQPGMVSSEGTTSPQILPTPSSVPESVTSQHTVKRTTRKESALPAVTVLTESNIREMINAVIKKCGGLKEFQKSFSEGFSWRSKKCFLSSYWVLPFLYLSSGLI